MNTIIALLLSASVATADHCDSSHAPSMDIVDTAIKAGSFKTLVEAVQAAGLVDTLKGKGPFTVFAPTDEAFAKLPKGTLSSLLKPENRATLTSILTYHVVAGDVRAKDVVKLPGATTVNGQWIGVEADKSGVRLGNANVVSTDILCKNGTIHVIDSVLMPQTKNLAEVAAGAKMFGTLIAAAKAAGLAGALIEGGPFTVFAPTDEAFAKLPAGTVESLLKPENKAKLVAILKAHIVQGRINSPDALKAEKASTINGTTLKIQVIEGRALVNESTIIKTDVNASNGVIHVIDKVIVPS